jgi:hypothetical protein
VTLFDEISQLLAAPADGADAPPLARLEDTLTAGYARALALEAERWRLERRIGEVAAALQDESSELRTDEIAKLAARLSDADGELSRLRGLLSTLRVRASDLRVTEASN